MLQIGVEDASRRGFLKGMLGAGALVLSLRYRGRMRPERPYDWTSGGGIERAAFPEHLAGD